MKPLSALAEHSTVLQPRDKALTVSSQPDHQRLPTPVCPSHLSIQGPRYGIWRLTIDDVSPRPDRFTCCSGDLAPRRTPVPFAHAVEPVLPARLHATAAPHVCMHLACVHVY